MAIISAGAGNSYSHPTASVPARLKASGAKVYRTDLDGTVNVKTDGKSWQVETERNDGSKAAPTPAPTPTGGTGQKYYGSKNSNVFHYPWCRYVSSIRAANLDVFRGRQSPIGKGHRRRRLCKS